MKKIVAFLFLFLFIPSSLSAATTKNVCVSEIKQITELQAKIKILESQLSQQKTGDIVATVKSISNADSSGNSKVVITFTNKTPKLVTIKKIRYIESPFKIQSRKVAVSGTTPAGNSYFSKYSVLPTKIDRATYELPIASNFVIPPDSETDLALYGYLWDFNITKFYTDGADIKGLPLQVVF